MKNKTAKHSPTLNKKVTDIRDTIKVRVSFSCYDGKMASDKVAKAAADAEHAAQARIEGKVILIERKAQKAVFSVKDAMTRRWRKATRPWEDGGWRLGLASEYGALRADLDEFERQYNEAVRAVVDRNYDTLKAEAEKELNGLAAGLFPSKQVLLSKYGVRIFTDVIASMDDLRFSGLSEAEAQRIAEERSTYLTTIVNEGNTEMVRDIAKAATTLRDTLAAPDKGFHGCSELGFPLIENLRSMLDHCEKFNITNDSKLATTIEATRTLLDKIDLSNVKQDKLARKEMAQVASSIVDELSKF